MTDIWWKIIELVLFPIIVSIVVKVFLHKFEKREREVDARREQAHQERQAEMKEAIQEELSPLQRKMDLLVKGTKCSLRNDIMNVYYDCKAKGYKTQDDAQNFRELCGAYHDLNGNSFIDGDIIPAFDELELK